MRLGDGLGREADFSTAQQTVRLSVASVEMTEFGLDVVWFLGEVDGSRLPRHHAAIRTILRIDS